jgi:hypothetical protein
MNLEGKALSSAVLLLMDKDEKRSSFIIALKYILELINRMKYFDHHSLAYFPYY